MSGPLSGARVLSSKERAYLVHHSDEEDGVHCGSTSGSRTRVLHAVTCVACLDAIQTDAEEIAALCIERKQELAT